MDTEHMPTVARSYERDSTLECYCGDVLGVYEVIAGKLSVRLRPERLRIALDRPASRVSCVRASRVGSFPPLRLRFPFAIASTLTKSSRSP
ncbi:hypothetical protein EXIGLDRAFT_262632 [Exidia glandulosa HHB12029]|uniref:Uncharacterized protein n=1 Tax=Exidia glandulosa HHB12029 TaxID=1314781 RepID=A0A165DSD8_EXIGL|nr:hypothetical protein EXIGLDRAFT_262632 [Exidia glandulosa HHB12029]